MAFFAAQTSHLAEDMGRARTRSVRGRRSPARLFNLLLLLLSVVVAFEVEQATFEMMAAAQLHRHDSRGALHIFVYAPHLGYMVRDEDLAKASLVFLERLRSRGVRRPRADIVDGHVRLKFQSDSADELEPVLRSMAEDQIDSEDPLPMPFYLFSRTTENPATWL